MKTPHTLSLVALVVSAVALAVAVAVSLASGAGGGDLAAGGAGDAAGAPPVTVGRDAALLVRVEALADRLDVLELQTARAPERAVAVGAGDVTREEFELLREDLRALREALGPAGVLAGSGALPGAAALGPDGEPESDALKDQVAAALEEIRKQERVDAVRAKLEARAANLEEALPRYTEWLSLSPYQSEQMRASLERQYAREDELVRMWEAGVSDELLGERKANDRAQFASELSGFLMSEQMETFEAGGK